jgi:hypothetical protein
MPPQLALDVLYSVASFLVGGTLTWRLLGRARRGHYRKLAQELTEGVYDRSSAYQKLEDRIDTVIAGFDQRESEIRDGFEDGIQAVDPAEVPAGAVGAATGTATDGDALSWMDSCDGPGDAISAEVSETAFVGLPVAEPRSVDATETVVDRFAQSLQVLQKEKSDELERQRNWIGTLEGRIQALESLMQEVAQRGSGAPGSRGDSTETARKPTATPVAEVAIWDQSIQAVYDRITRSERDLAAWHAHHEGLARDRSVSVRRSTNGPRKAATAARRLIVGMMMSGQLAARLT